MLFKNFIFKTLIVVIITTLVNVLIFKLFFPDKMLMVYFFIPSFFGAVNILIFKSLFKAREQNLLKFSNRYLIFTTIKLLASIFFIIGFLFFNRNQTVPFLASFLAVYLIFLVHEITEILNFFKKIEKSETTQTKT